MGTTRQVGAFAAHSPPEPAPRTTEPKTRLAPPRPAGTQHRGTPKLPQRVRSTKLKTRANMSRARSTSDRQRGERARVVRTSDRSRPRGRCLDAGAEALRLKHGCWCGRAQSPAAGGRSWPRVSRQGRAGTSRSFPPPLSRRGKPTNPPSTPPLLAEEDPSRDEDSSSVALLSRAKAASGPMSVSSGRLRHVLIVAVPSRIARLRLRFPREWCFAGGRMLPHCCCCPARGARRRPRSLRGRRPEALRRPPTASGAGPEVTRMPSAGRSRPH